MAVADVVKFRGMRNRSERFSFAGFVIFFGVMLLGMQIFEQYFGWRVGYNPALGGYWFGIGSHKFYYPGQWIIWAFTFVQAKGALAHELRVMELGAIGSSLLAVVVGYIFYYRRSLEKEDVEGLHGDAKFADDNAVRNMKLLSDSLRGLIIGAYMFAAAELHFLRYTDNAHLLLCAPTRGGKGVSIVIPMLLTYGESVLVNDIKGENYELSAGFRHRSGSLCMRMDPTHVPRMSIDGVTLGLNTCRYNIFNEIRIFSDWDVQDTQNIAAAIADPDGKGMDDHWVSTSYELLTGLFLHLKYAGLDASLAGASRFLGDPSFNPAEQMFNEMINEKHDPGYSMGWTDTMSRPTGTHPVIADAASTMLKKEEKERNSVLSTAKTRLALFMEPIVARNTSRSDFVISDLMNHLKPVSLYMVVPPSDKERLRPFTRLFITFLIRRMGARMDFQDGASANSYLHPLVGVIDELPSLRKLDALEDALSYIAGYGIRFFLIYQDDPQLLDEKKGFGSNQQIKSGCQVQIYFTPNTHQTAESISKMLGTRTVEVQRATFSGRRMGPMMDQMSVNIDHQRRDLMLPEEVRQMKEDETLIFIRGQDPIRGKKVPYYQVPMLLDRARLPAPMRVGMAWRKGEEKSEPLTENWLMLTVEREKGQLWAYINVYSDYPSVKPVIKQVVLATGEVIELEGALVDEDGRPWVGDLPLRKGVLRYRIDYAAHPLFDFDEKFEAHLPLSNADGFEALQQTGFYVALSEHERDARFEMRKKVNVEYGKEPRFIEVGINTRCEGKIYWQSEKCVVMQWEEDAYYVHNKAQLDVQPKIGDYCVIKYQKWRGHVEIQKP